MPESRIDREKAGFGELVRRLRQDKGVSLRRFSKMVCMSPAYLSRVERGEFPPPAEDKVVAMASALEVDSDEFLARANRVSSDLPDIIKKRPRALAEFLRCSEDVGTELIRETTERLRQEAASWKSVKI